MDILIRGIDEGVIKKIDNMAKKDFPSRNDFLKAYIENLSVLDVVTDIERRYKNLVEQQSKIIELNTELLKQLVAENMLDISKIIEGDYSE